MKDRELMEMALDALESCGEDRNQDGEAYEYFDWRKVEAAKKALRNRLDQPEHTPEVFKVMQKVRDQHEEMKKQIMKEWISGRRS